MQGRVSKKRYVTRLPWTRKGVQHAQLSKFLPSYCSRGFALRFAIEFVSRFVAASRVAAHHLGGF
jgi:hypothetical protein